MFRKWSAVCDPVQNVGADVARVFRTDAEWVEALAEIGMPRHPGVGQVEIEASLNAAGCEVDEVMDEPDRPGLEWVLVARRA